MKTHGKPIKELIIDNSYASVVTSEERHGEGNIVPNIRHTLMPVSKLKNIIKHQMYQFEGRDVILPGNCKFFKQYPSGEKLLIIEETPQVRTLSIDFSITADVERLKKTGKLKLYGFEDFLETNDRPYEFHLSFPYIVYFILLGLDNRSIHHSIFYRLSPLSSCADLLITTNLLNVGSEDNICIGSFYPNDYNLTTIVNEVVSSFWLNSFNDDFTERYTEYIEVEGVDNFLTWSYNTKLDPMFIFDVKWKPSHNNVHDVIRLIEKYVDRVDSDFNFMDMASYQSLSKETKAIKHRLDTNITDSIALIDDVISVGESFKYKNGKEVYVNSFDGLRDEVSHVEVEKWDGKTIRLKLTEEVREFIEDQLNKKDPIDSVNLPTGELVKIDDLLTVSFPFRSFRKVENIRIARDGKIEIKLGGDFYLLENLQASILNEDKFEIGDVIIEKNKDYVLIEKNYSERILCPAIESKFIGLRSSNNNRRIILDFESKINNEKFSPDIEEYTITTMDKLEPISSNVFSVGPMLYTGDNNLYRFNDHIVTTSNPDPYYTRIEIPNQDHILSCVTEDCISIPNLSSETEFKVGDDIVVADWSDPLSLFEIQKIVKFSVEDKFVYINAVNSAGNILKIPFIDIEQKRAAIGHVRRIVDEYEELKAGMIIKATKKGISNFPLKDVNMIIGFLNDTGETPIALCSNGCTLWPVTIRNSFTEITATSPEWSRACVDVHTPVQPHKIKAQAGDFFSDLEDKPEFVRYVLAYTREFIAPRLVSTYSMKNITRYDIYPFLGNNHYLKYGFPSPRYIQHDIEYVEKTKGVPTMCNTYIPIEDFDLLFPLIEETEYV